MKNKIKKLLLFVIRRYLSFIEREIINDYKHIAIQKISQSTNIVNPIETLQQIEKTILNKEKGAYMRFGDGDAYLSIGKNDMLQTSSSKIKQEMIEAFCLHGDTIFKCLSIHSNLYGKEDKMFIGNHLVSDELANNLLSNTFYYFVGNKIYSPVALHYASTYYPNIANKFLKVLKNSTSLFIGNQEIPYEIIAKLFGNIPHVKTPSRNSYKQIDRIEIEASEHLGKIKDFSVVVVAMGCSGRPLMKRLYKKNFNIFLFDFGSLLDGICGYNSRTWLKKTNIDYSLLLKDL